MTLKDLIKQYGSQAAAARQLKMHRQRVSRWADGIPLDAQIEIELMTKGRLKANLPRQLRRATA